MTQGSVALRTRVYIDRNFANSEDSVSSQTRYHDALRGHLASAIQIIEGYYDAKPARAYLCEKGKTARECPIAEIWKLEEKQSDIALALHAYSDALRGEVDHIAAITNDTDFVPALDHQKSQLPVETVKIEDVIEIGAGTESMLECFTD